MSRYVSPKMQKDFQEALGKAMEKAGITTTPVYSSSGNTSDGGIWYACWDSNSSNIVGGGHIKTEKDFIPTKIIYSCPATICYFPDGTKEVVKCAYDEEYIPEVGVAQCIMKKLFKSRNEFKRLVKSGYENQEAEVERVLHNGSVDKIKTDKLAEQLKAFTVKLAKEK